MTTAEHTQKRDWRIAYTVTADWRPYRRWIVRAESEFEARAMVSAEIGVPVDELAASPGGAV